MKFDESVKFERLKLLELHLRTLTRRVIETLASVKASHDGWGRIPVAEGRTVSNVNPNLIRCSVITGRGIDVDTGEPIANQHISFCDAARPESQAANHGAKSDEIGTCNRYAVGIRFDLSVWTEPES